MTHNIAWCIELAESALQHHKTHQTPEKQSPRLYWTGDIFFMIDRLDSSLTDCVKMAEDNLQTRDSKNLKDPGSKILANPRRITPDLISREILSLGLVRTILPVLPIPKSEKLLANFLILYLIKISISWIALTTWNLLMILRIGQMTSTCLLKQCPTPITWLTPSGSKQNSRKKKEELQLHPDTHQKPDKYNPRLDWLGNPISGSNRADCIQEQDLTPQPQGANNSILKLNIMVL